MDRSVELGVFSLKALHELMVESGVLAHALGHCCELWVRHEAHQLVLTSWHLSSHATAHSWITHARVFITVVGDSLTTIGGDLIQVNTF